MIAGGLLLAAIDLLERWIMKAGRGLAMMLDVKTPANWERRGGYPAGNVPADQLRPPPPHMTATLASDVDLGAGFTMKAGHVDISWREIPRDPQDWTAREAALVRTELRNAATEIVHRSRQPLPYPEPIVERLEAIERARTSRRQRGSGGTGQAVGGGLWTSRPTSPERLGEVDTWCVEIGCLECGQQVQSDHVHSDDRARLKKGDAWYVAPDNGVGSWTEEERS